MAAGTEVERGIGGAGGPPHREGSATAGSAGIEQTQPASRIPLSVVSVSAETGEGLAELREAVARVLGERYGAPPLDAPVVTRERHRRALAEARAEVALFREAWVDDALPAPVAAVHLRAAVHALEGLIGVVDREEVLGRLFASFCVGK